LRAARLTLNGETVGYLGEGPGPFIFASQSTGAYPVLKNCRYTSIDQLAEDDVAQIVERDLPYDETLAALKQRGFTLLPVSYAEQFLSPKDAPLGGADGGWRR
jgi:hypothetical protein